MRYAPALMLLAVVCGCGQFHEAGEQTKTDLPEDCQKLESVDVFFCGETGNGVCYKAVCIIDGRPVTYLRYKGGAEKWSKYEFYFAAKPKTTPGAGSRD